MKPVPEYEKSVNLNLRDILKIKVLAFTRDLFYCLNYFLNFP